MHSGTFGGMTEIKSPKLGKTDLLFPLEVLALALLLDKLTAPTVVHLPGSVAYRPR